jgi:EAL domain-containing protein (putative c-di-GMP-specific phosphodiesterase class I)
MSAPTGCTRCAERRGNTFTMAFQPISDIAAGLIFAHEALLRGIGGEPAGKIFAEVTHDNRYSFDQACRTCANSRAAELGCT